VIAIDVELLTGRYVATSFSNRRAAEWPPHPARFFSALVATASKHAELVADARHALEWLEQQGPPHVLASEAEPRLVVTAYVPENTTRVLGDWSAQEERLAAALAEIEEAERTGNAGAVRRARKAVDRAREKLDAEVAKAISDASS
jgi:CRISPR-associated protein Csb2